MLSGLRFDRPYVPCALYFKYNTSLGPPFLAIVDTNFINFSIQNKVPFFFFNRDDVVKILRFCDLISEAEMLSKQLGCLLLLLF